MKELKKIYSNNENTILENKKAVQQLKTKMEFYQQIVEKYENKNQEMRMITAEVERLQIEAKQEATLIIATRMKEIINDDQEKTKEEITQEYNFYFKIKGFTELERKLKEIVKLNKNLAEENNKLKFQLDKLKQKHRDRFEKEKKKIKVIHREMIDLLKAVNTSEKNLIDFYFYIHNKKRKKQIK